MAIPPVPNRHQDSAAHRQVMAERINQIRDFTFDDSRVRSGAEIAAGVTPINFAYAPLNVWRYMTSAQIADVIARTLTLDCRAAIQTAISVAQQTPGGEVYIPSGAYLINRVASLDSQFNGIWIPYTNVFGYTGAGITLVGDGQSTSLYAGDNDMTVIRWSDSNGRLDNLSLEVNGKTGASGLSLISSNTGSATIAEHIDWNTFSRLSINGFAEGIELESPSLGGCYYNRFRDIRLYNNTRHIRLRDNATSKGANRNAFYSCSMAGGNNGFYIDGADTTQIVACTFEVIATGTSPIATPTAIYTTHQGSLGGLLTVDTNVITCIFEGCTKDLECNNRRISILGGNLGAVGAVAGSETPDLWIGGDAQYLIRNLLMGSSTTDGLSMSPRNSAYTASPQVATSANVAGAFPFENDGSLILQARKSASSGVQLAVGASATKGVDILGTGEVVMRAGTSLALRKVAVTYSASMTLDTSAGNYFEIVATNGTAFTINAPTNALAGREITIIIFNTSGGALGAVTWNAAFKMSAWTSPATGNNRSISFVFDPGSWYQKSQTGIDVPN